MIVPAQGNLLTADADALVNSVNCEGFMGKGIALQFKKAFPANFEAYRRACKQGAVVPGRMLVHETGALARPHYVINFPTKRQWRSKSRLEDIRDGLGALVAAVRERGIESIAVPPLGCGLGGLDWRDVRPLIVKAFEGLPHVRVLLFEPSAAPTADQMPIRTARPAWTTARAMFVALIGTYAELAYRLSLLELQKLAYFLQEGGQPLRLRYVKHHYGPYAHNLNKVLERLEGHSIRGYGDSHAPDVTVELTDTALPEVEAFLQDDAPARARLERVARLIDGFETPYGMELLASVHWVAAHDRPAARNADDAVGAIHAWSDRKRRLLRDEHVRLAWRRLHEEGWLPTSAAS